MASLLLIESLRLEGSRLKKTRLKGIFYEDKMDCMYLGFSWNPSYGLLERSAAGF